MKIIKEAVQNLVVYMLMVTVILNLVKASSYKKYIELFTGLVLLLILFTPLAKLFSAEETFYGYWEANQFSLETKDFAEFIYEAEDGTKDELLRLYGEKVEERVRLLGERDGITVEKVKTKLNPAEDGFGSVEKIEVWILGEGQGFGEALAEAFSLSQSQVTVRATKESLRSY